MKHFSCALRFVADQEWLSFGQFEVGQNRQIVRDHRTPYVLFKPFPGAPGTAGQSKGPLQPGDVRLDSGSKILKLLINPVAFDHLQNRKPPFLGERNVLDPQLFGSLQIVQRGKSSVSRRLPRRCLLPPVLHDPFITDL